MNFTDLRLTRNFLPILLAASLLSCRDPVEPAIHDLDRLARRLEALRNDYHIPALSAGIINSDGTTWTRGFGKTPDGTAPTPQSIFHLASLTKTFASATILKLAQDGKLSLDDNVSKYGIHFTNSNDVRVWHLMSHTSEGTPGEQFRYNGNRFAQLDRVIARAAGKTFAELLKNTITAPHGMTCTGPSTDAALRAHLVPGFAGDGKSIAYPATFSSAAGTVSCVEDLLTYSMAWDSDKLVSAASKAKLWTATRSGTGAKLPYGLGWFVDEIDGQKIVWHYGLWTGISALIIKLPEKHLTYVLLANNDQLGLPTRLGSGDLLSAPFARVFLAWALQRDIPKR